MPANSNLAEHAGKQITVIGTVKEADGQKLISITEIKTVN